MKQFIVRPKTTAEAYALIAVARSCNATNSIADDTIEEAAERYTRQYPTIIFTQNSYPNAGHRRKWI